MSPAQQELLRRLPSGPASSSLPSAAGAGASASRASAGAPEIIDAPSDAEMHASRPMESALSSREWEELVNEITRRIEHRVSRELSRRGRGYVPRSL